MNKERELSKGIIIKGIISYKKEPGGNSKSNTCNMRYEICIKRI